MAFKNDSPVVAKHEEFAVKDDDTMPSATPEKSLSLWANIRKYPRITAWSFSLTLGILLWGYDLVIVGTVSSIPAFQKVFGEPRDDRWIIPASWLAVWAVSTNTGLMAGSIVFGWVQDRIGRRYSLVITSLICSASVGICYVSDLPPTLGGRRGVFFLAKAIQGFAIGGIMCTTQTWLSEVAPTELRGPLMATFPIFKLLGQLVGALFCFSVIGSDSRSAFRLCFATQWPFSGPLTITAFLLPESPAWLLRKDKDAAASKAMGRLRGRKDKDQADTALHRLREAIQTEKQDSHIEKETYWYCFKGTQLRRTTIVCFAEFIPLLFGLQLLGSASYFLQQIGMDPGTSVMFLIIGIAIGVIASCITFYTMSKCGRRKLILISLAVISLIWGAIGFSGIWQNTGAMWFTAVGMMSVIFTAGIGAWPATYAVASEASALRLRAKTQGLGWFAYGLGTMVFGLVMPYLYNPDAANLGSKTAFVYFALSGLGAMCGFVILPEMKGRSAQEIDKMFDLKVPTRKFRHWDVDEDSV